VAKKSYLTIDQIDFDLKFSAPSTSNISIIWSLTNSANVNHTFTDDLQKISNGTKALTDHAYGMPHLVLFNPSLLTRALGILDDLSEFTMTLLKELSPERSEPPLGQFLGQLVLKSVHSLSHS
jgi:hypothetical protein